MYKYSAIRKLLKALVFSTLVLTTLILTACSGNVGVGVSVGVPIGNNGHISVGTGTRHRGWY